jgi:cyclophilin family peptidyl-prolyl cis-trans isomerase
MRFAFALLGPPLLATPPSFTVREAIRAEWKRLPPVFNETEITWLPAADRARLELTLKRIGAPSAPALLPPELDKPTLEIWEAKATVAKTPQERFTALFFLNRLKSAKALFTLEGLGAKDAESWPKPLHLEAQIASAQLNGCEVGPELRGFLNALQKAGKIDPVRAQAARLRLVMGGKEKDLLPPVKATAGSLLALMDAWNRAPWEKRASDAKNMVQARFAATSSLQWWTPLGLQQPQPSALLSSANGIYQRLLEGLPPKDLAHDFHLPLLGQLDPRFLGTQGRLAALGHLSKFRGKESVETLLATYRSFAGTEGRNPSFDVVLLGSLRQLDPMRANALRGRMLAGSDPIARAAAIGDMNEATADFNALIQRLWKVEEYDGVQVLLHSLEKWQLPEERRGGILRHFLDHPCWTARLDAWRKLSKLDAKTPWPAAPKPSNIDAAILKEAGSLATAGKPVRMRLHFAGKRQVTLKLDPLNAPMNVANLVLLARKGFFDGRLVPRVVPDFVVQMGSPCDTMDGGPGYTVRCENSLDWYGPGSVGMALDGKDTGGSQFFITTNAAPHLTGNYTRVGEVEDPDRALKILDDLELGAKLERVEILMPRMKR